MAKIDIFTNTWSDIIFEGRNQEYGAYQLRKIGPKYLVRGIVFSILGFGLAISAPVIMKYITDALPQDDVKVTEATTLADIPPVDKTEPPPPPVEPPPPLKATVKFTPPVVVPQEEVEEPPPAQEELKEKETSTVTQEGDPNGVPEGLGEGNEVVEEAPPQIFTVVEEMPTFPGGEAEMMNYIRNKTQYPQIEKENGIQGKVFIEFVINTEGNVTQARVARGIPGGSGCDAEALRVIKSFPKWTPGRQNGRPAMVKFTIPVNFKLR